MNSFEVKDVRVGLATKTTKDNQVAPLDNPATKVIDETTLSIDSTYATVFNSVVGKDFLYVINTLKLPKPPAEYPKFTVMLYTEIITSADDPIEYLSTTPDFETVTASTPFFGENHIESQLWMTNQYAYVQESDVEKLFDS